MRITSISDVHLEIHPHMELPGGDVLLMAGDIFTAFALNPKKTDKESRKERNAVANFCQKQLSKYDRVFYVLGNHEHYRFLFEETASAIRSFLAEHAPNVRLLDNEITEHEGVVIVGTTLWSRCGVGTADEWRINNAMNDFRLIRTQAAPVQPIPLLKPGDRRAFQPADANRAHETALAFLKRETPPDKPVILLTHHAPCFQSANGPDLGSAYLDDAYCADLVDFLLERPNIRLAVHGHTHRSEDYYIGETRVLSNPRGYFPYQRLSLSFDPAAADTEWSFKNE